jgi:hypothetical protein
MPQVVESADGCPVIQHAHAPEVAEDVPLEGGHTQQGREVPLAKVLEVRDD